MAITSTNNLRKGSKGDDVKALQQALNGYGYGLDVDGSFGSKTQAAVKDYQTRNGLTADGIVGTHTWFSLQNGSAAGTQASEASSATATPLTALQQVVSERPTFNYQEQTPVYAANPTYQQQIEALTEKAFNRDPFKYDLNADTLYQQYKNQYTALGKRAAADAQAQAAALSGGYGNSYGATVGNQAYQNYLNRLNDIIPELESNAYNKWLNEGETTERQLELLRDMEAQDYDRYADALAQYNADRNFAYDQYADAMAGWRADRAYEYGVEQDALDRELAALASSASSSGSSGSSRRASSSETPDEELQTATANNAGSQAAAAIRDLSSELQSFADINDSAGLEKFLNALVKKGYITSQTATALYSRYFPKQNNSAVSGASRSVSTDSSKANVRQ